MSALLGIDIGTTATKAVVLDSVLTMGTSGSRPTRLDSPQPGWAEEDPGEWWANVCDLARAAMESSPIGAVGVSGMVPCVVLVGDNGQVLRPSIQQNDSRAIEEIAELRSRFPESEIVERTGSAITQQSVAPTLLWLQRNEPDVWQQVRWVMGSYDYVAYRLTGVPTVERNWALESGLYDLGTEDWAWDVVDAAGFDGRFLPPIGDPSDVVGTITSAAAAETGLPAGTPVVAGAADHVASAFASGAIDEGDLVVKLGGAGDILFTTDRPLVDERLYLDFHMVPGRYLPNGCMATSGTFVKWFQRELSDQMPLAELDAEAAKSGPGAAGIVALPYLLGEKTPINDPLARGAFVGLHLGHGRGDLFRAVLEAVAFGFRQHLEILAERGFTPRRIRLTDGGSKSTVWAQIISDVIEQPLEPVSFTGGSALGVAYAAGVGIGAIDGWDGIGRLLELSPQVEPQPDERYERNYRIYQSLYPALRGVVE
ncbi:MAG: FGGY-family carbohydrate kinase [Acidimicrobiia bacterium]|jgi:xylulokinase